MSRMLLMLGLVSALSAAIFAEDCDDPATPSCDTGNECTVTVSLNSSGAVVLAGKPPDNEPYRADFGGYITWKFVNTTGVPISVRLSSWELDSGRKCPVRFEQGGGPGDCEAFLPTIQSGGTPGLIRAEAIAAHNDMNDPFDFDIFIGKNGEAPRPVDPELQIDDFRRLPFILSALGILSALFFFASWWTRRRTPGNS